LYYWAVPEMNKLFIEEPRVTEFNPDQQAFFKLFAGTFALSVGGKYLFKQKK